MLAQEARGEWLEHQIRQGDGQGGWVTRPAQQQVLRHPDCEHTMPFGLVQMDTDSNSTQLKFDSTERTYDVLLETNCVGTTAVLRAAARGVTGVTPCAGGSPRVAQWL
jgi:hypothetical protein